MVYLIIGLALVFIIVPIIAVLPSARQKQQMAMRTAARGVGVLVELTSIDDPVPKQDKYLSSTGRALPPVLKVAAYRKQRRRQGDWRRLPQVNWCYQRKSEGQWCLSSDLSQAMSVELKSFLAEAVNLLPDDVEQVEESGYVVSVYWHERSKNSESKVLDFLEQCVSLPLHDPSAIDPEINPEKGEA